MYLESHGWPKDPKILRDIYAFHRNDSLIVCAPAGSKKELQTNSGTGQRPLRYNASGQTPMQTNSGAALQTQFPLTSGHSS